MIGALLCSFCLPLPLFGHTRFESPCSCLDRVHFEFSLFLRCSERFEAFSSGCGLSCVGSLLLAFYPVHTELSSLFRFFARFGSSPPSFGRHGYASSLISGVGGEVCVREIFVFGVLPSSKCSLWFVSSTVWLYVCRKFVFRFRSRSLRVGTSVLDRVPFEIAS